MMRRYYKKNRINHTSLSNNIKFAFGKIGKELYLLHILTTIANSVFLFVGQAKNSLLVNILRIIANIFLVQEWIPISSRSINATSWYLSTMLFCWFVFPYILNLFEKKINNRNAKYWMIILFAIQIIIGFIMSLFNNSFIEPNDFSYWIIYRFPITRCIDFIIGCILGYLSINEKNSMVSESDIKVNKSKYIIPSIITIVVIVISNILFVLNKVDEPYGYMTNWWCYSVLFTIGTCPLVYLASKQESLLSKMITNRFTVYLGNISQYVFLIHYVVFTYISSGLMFLLGGEVVEKYVPWILLLIGIPLSIILSHIWMKIIKKCKVLSR